MQYIDSEVLVELVPRLTDLIKSGIGIGTKVGDLKETIQLEKKYIKIPNLGNS